MARILCTLGLALALWAPAAHARDVVIFAAASLKSVLDETVEAYRAQGDLSVTVSYAGSSALARQIQMGAPADIFISANMLWMDRLDAEGLVRPDTRRVLAGNRLVLIGPEAEAVPLTPDALSQTLGPDGRLAMALVQAVPAGIYGKAALETLGAWDVLADRVAQTDNVRAALRLVELGEARLGVVYATDAQQSAAVSVVAPFPADSHPPILYPVALTTEGLSPRAAEVLAFLTNDAAQEIFARHGFLPGAQE